MDNIKSIVVGGIITLIIGGGAYTFSQVDFAKNFASDTGLTQEQAEEYINSVTEDDLASWKEVGSSYIEEGQVIIDSANEIDCLNYEYEWESATLPCVKGKMQLEKVGKDSKLLGQMYIKLDSDSATEKDISEVIRLIDQYNSDYNFEIISYMIDLPEIDEIKKTNLYNKALLKTALESI
jgi:hypothetical protein